MKRWMIFFTALFLGLSVQAQTEMRRPAQSRPADTKSMTGEKMGYLYSTAYRNEIGASSTYGEIASAKGTVFRASAAYKYMFMKAMQAGVLVDMLLTSGGDYENNSYFGVWGTFTYNFNQSWNNSDSFFGEVAAGMVDTALASNYVAKAGAKSEKKFSYAAMFGKYIPLWERIKYTPKAGIRKVGDLDMQIVIIPLNLTIVF